VPQRHSSPSGTYAPRYFFLHLNPKRFDILKIKEFESWYNILSLGAIVFIIIIIFTDGNSPLS
jgi:hypothetical protein